jgi:alpha-mannosidase
VILVNAKRADDGQGLVLRLFETAGRKVEARVKCGFKQPRKASLVRLTEDLPPSGGKPLSIDKDTILSEIGPFEIQTIRVAP